jgi:hypothetical protein
VNPRISFRRFAHYHYCSKISELRWRGYYLYGRVPTQVTPEDFWQVDQMGPRLVAHTTCWLKLLRRAVLLILLLVGLLPDSFALLPRAQAATGGPDAFGYIFADSAEAAGPTFHFEDISATGTPVSLSDDQVSGAIPLGFTFVFYGIPYSNI